MVVTWTMFPMPFIYVLSLFLSHLFIPYHTFLYLFLYCAYWYYCHFSYVFHIPLLLLSHLIIIWLYLDCLSRLLHPSLYQCFLPNACTITLFSPVYTISMIFLYHFFIFFLIYHIVHTCTTLVKTTADYTLLFAASLFIPLFLHPPCRCHPCR